MMNHAGIKSVLSRTIVLMATFTLASCGKSDNKNESVVATVPSPQICAQSSYQPDWYNQTGFQSYNWSYVNTNNGWQNNGSPGGWNQNQYQQNNGAREGDWICQTPYEFGETYCYRQSSRQSMQPMPRQQMMPGQQMPYPNQQMPYPNRQMPYPNNGGFNQQAQMQSFSTGFCGCQQQAIPACGPQGMVCIPVTVNLTHNIATYQWNQTTNAFIAGGFQAHQTWMGMRSQSGCSSVMAQACDTRTPSCTSGRCVATGTNGSFGGICVQ